MPNGRLILNSPNRRWRRGGPLTAGAAHQCQVASAVKVPLTITVPDTYGHYTEPSASVMTPSIIAGGTAEVQVAP